MSILSSPKDWVPVWLLVCGLPNDQRDKVGLLYEEMMAKEADTFNHILLARAYAMVTSRALVDLSGAADEYEEAMLALDIMEGLK